MLVQLTDSPEGRVRVTDLARALSWEKSRASHHLTRMERRGLVAREECRDDGRGAFVALTPEDRTAIEGAALGHVQTAQVYAPVGRSDFPRLAVMASQFSLELSEREVDEHQVQPYLSAMSSRIPDCGKWHR